MKQFLLFFSLFLPLYGFAQTKVIYLQGEGPGDSGIPHRNVIPVHYDENNVIIRSDSTIYCADIVIKDQKGEVMNRQQLDILPKADNVISAPNSPDSEKQTIEIIVDKQRYIGYFE